MNQSQQKTIKKFTKPAISYVQQLRQLISRGMVVTQPRVALRALRQFNYYRLSAYWKPFEISIKRSEYDGEASLTHYFQQNITFEDVLNLYYFDRQLRLLVMDAIERIEVSVRSRWAYVLAHRHGVHAHLDSTIARDFWSWHGNLKKIKDSLNSSKKMAFVEHFKETYEEPSPPIWVVCEVMSFGLLSKYYDNLKPKETRRTIAKAYGLDDECLASWLQHLTEIRNVCAHHSRLWNKQFVKTPQKITGKPSVLAGQFTNTRTIYNTLMILLYSMDSIEPQHDWRTELLALLNQHPALLPRMGFPLSWATQPIWSDIHA